MQRHRTLFENEIDQADINIIRYAALFSMPTGNSRFKEQIAKIVNRKLGYAKRGRPNKISTELCK